MRRIWWLFLVVGCGREGNDREPRIVSSMPTARPGWRAVSLPRLGLQLEFPESHVRGVVDRSTRDCSTVPSLPGFEWDSVSADTLVVTTAPRGFDSIAAAMGFEATAGGYEGAVDTLGGAEWTEVDSLRIGPWQALTAVRHAPTYFEDMQYEPKPGDPPDARMPHDEMLQARFVAAAAGPSRCAIVLAWRGRIVRASKDGHASAEWPRDLLGRFLERAIIAKPSSEP
jgi:hypothetical protein